LCCDRGAVSPTFDCVQNLRPVDHAKTGFILGQGLMAQRVPLVVAELGAGVDPFILHLFAVLEQFMARQNR
jgi:hypothetical protein